MKYQFAFLFFLIVSLAYGQTSDWETIAISNWGYIKIPPSMEIQRGIYKKTLDLVKKKYSVNADRIVFQQKGLNDFGSFDTYARVIIRTDNGTPGDFPKLNQLNLTKSEVAEINSFYKQEIMSVSRRQNASLLKWADVKMTELNGYQCLYFNYSRQVYDKPPTFSEFYIFFNYSKQHTLNFEYRIEDKDRWEPDLKRCMSSFRFQ